MSIQHPRVSAAPWPVSGHEWAVGYLQKVVDSDRTPDIPTEGRTASSLRHAYLVTGPTHLGKTTLVRAFAQALLCTANDAGATPVPCGECRSCRLMAGMQHPDFRLVPPTDRDGAIDRANGRLRVEQSGEMIREAALRPVEGRYKVFLIQDAHLAQAEFAHKILKTLEEPPSHVVICVTANHESQLLPTIVSRCETMGLRPVPVATIRDALIEKHAVGPERAELLARLSGGRVGWAVRQLENDGTDNRLQMLGELWQLVAASRVERLRFAEQTAANRDNLSLFAMLELWSTWWRDVLLAQNSCTGAISNVDQEHEVERYASELSVSSVRRHLETLMRVERYLHHTVNTRLAMDALLLDMPRLAA